MQDFQSNSCNTPETNAEGAQSPAAFDAGNQGSAPTQAGFGMNADGTAVWQSATGRPSLQVNATVNIADTAASTTSDLMQTTAMQSDLHALDTGLGHVQLKAAADVLAHRRTVWEFGAFKSSNAELIALLADCLGLYLHLLKFDDARKQFHVIYKEANLPSTKGTELMTKIVRYVFGEAAEKRTFVYAKVLSVADEENVTPETLAAFVASRGGLEQVRRNTGDAVEKRKVRAEDVKKASASLKIATPLAGKVVPPKSLKVTGETNFVAAVARREADGTLSIVHVSTNAGLIESLLANAAKDIVKSDISSETQAYVAGRA